MIPPEGRWPPVYDAEDLENVIRDLAQAGDFEARFWTLTLTDPAPCQGDVVRLPAEVPVLDERGQPAATDPCEHWLLIGNTCDFSRPVTDVEFTQLVPLVDLGAEHSRSAVVDFRSYRHSRRFYVPPWPAGDGHHRFADFTRPVPLHKAAFPSAAVPVARMQFPAWVLLHSCLIRFLARDDGRFD